MWCGKCYTTHPRNPFPIKLPLDEEGDLQIDERDLDRFKTGRDGDHLITAFQCDLCHFRNIQGRDPREGNFQDESLLVFIRRANLDALWSREPATVQKNRLTYERGAQGAASMGIESKMFPPMGPFPLSDQQGMGQACVILQRSLDPGKNETFIQFGTVRKMRSMFSNLWQASAVGLQDAVMAQEMRKTYVTSSPTYLAWFEKFMVGFHKRVGDEVKPDLAFSIEVMYHLQAKCEMRFRESVTDKGRRLITELISFMLIMYCGSLRGEEVPKCDAAGFNLNFEEGMAHPKFPHVPVCLLGRFKNERGERYCVIPVAACTASGLQSGTWIGRLILQRREQGRMHGPLFTGSDGRSRMKMSEMEPLLYELLSEIQKEHPMVISTRVSVVEEYGMSRSARRGAVTTAQVAGVDPTAIDLQNRWRSEAAARGRMMTHACMRKHYSDIKLMLSKQLEFSAAL